MDLDLTGRHALVCGASEGIGRATAHELALLGADVTLLSRRPAALAEVVATLPVRATQAHGWLAADLADLNGLDAQVRALCAGRPVHILVNNTGGPPGGPVESATLDAFRDAFALHVLANQTLARAVLGGMESAAFGRIVNVVSTSVREPIPNLGVSNTIRGAVASWAKTLSREVAARGITVNNVLPGYTKTGRLDQILDDRSRATRQSRDDVAEGMRRTVPVARFAEPHEVAAVIAFLCSPAAAYVNGVSLAVDGGRMQSI